MTSSSGDGTPGANHAVPVVFVSSHATRAGSERYLALLLEHLSTDWINSVVCLQEGPFADELRANGHPVEVIETGPRARDIARAAHRLRKSFARTRPEVVHANGVKAALVAELATVGTPTPVIWFKHDVAMDGWRGRLVARHAALVVGVSAAVMESLEGSFPGRLEVLHCQIPDPPVDPAAARDLVLREFEPDRPEAVVVLVGRLDAYKGQGELIAAAGSILARAPGVRFLLVGGDDPTHRGQRAALEREVVERGLEGAVRFTGFRTDALDLICGSDVLVISSIARHGFGKEGFGYVGLEALALRTPIVYYADGGIPEQVGECGLAVPPGDRVALGEAILHLVEDPERRRELAACGRERFQRNYLWSTLADDVAERYRRVSSP